MRACPFAALFSAVEHGHLEKARTILESSDVNVNSLNSDGLSPLDVALLSNNRPMTKMLQQRGAREAFQCEFRRRWEAGRHPRDCLTYSVTRC